jgi:hypothetical protein
MNIDLTPELKDTLLNRLKSELTETLVANFALDIILKNILIERDKALEHNAALLERIKSQDELIVTLRESINPGRKYNRKIKSS